jgi:hypothetical protein
MSITPGFRANRKFILIALRRDEDEPSADYIANGATPLAMQTKGLTVEPLITEQITRDIDDGQTGGEHVINVGAMIKIGGMIELAGSGAAGTPVPYHPVIEMAGFSNDTATAGEVNHTRILEALEEQDGCVYFHWQGEYHILLGGKSTLTIKGKVNELPYVEYELMGIYGGTIEGAAPQADFGLFQLPAEFGQARTTVMIGGQKLNAISFESSLNNTIEYTRGTELEEMYIDKWDEKGKIEIEKPALSTFDPFALKLENVLTSYNFTHGTEAGSIIEMTSSSGFQILDVAHGSYKGKSTYILDFGVIKGHDSRIRTA